MIRYALALAPLALAACGPIAQPSDPDAPEDIDTVTLTFEPASAGPSLVYRWADPPGVEPPSADDVFLDLDQDYTLHVHLGDAHDEIVTEADEHQLFFTGISVEGPATGTNPFAMITHTYADLDRAGLPIGLESEIGTRAAGSGPLVLTVQHILRQPSGLANKEAGLAEQVAADGLGTLPGEPDLQIEWVVEVQP